MSGGDMTNPKATDSTTAETTKELDVPPARGKSYGDPVIVDDGGSTNIDQNGSSLPGLCDRTTKHDVAGGKFTDGAKLTVFYSYSLKDPADNLEQPLGPWELSSKDVIQITSNLHSPSGLSYAWVTLKVKKGSNNQLDIDSSDVAQELANPKRYRIAETGKIALIKRQRHDGTVDPIFNIGNYPGATFVRVVVKQAP